MKHEHINTLVSAREAKDKADAAYQEYLDKHPEFKAAETTRKEANKAVKEAEGKVRGHYNIRLSTSGKEALPDGIGVRYSKEVSFMDSSAYLWAFTHGHVFLDFNRERLSKAILANVIPHDLTAMFNYTVIDRSTITIAKDLKAVEDESDG